MNGLRFELLSPVVEPAPLRTDIACFAGFVRRRAVPVPASLERWLRTRGYEPGDLLDVPVPIDTWDHFDALFAWEQRIAGDPSQGGTYLGAAIRSYFAQGGRKCYVIRTGDPWPLNANSAERLTALARVFPGYQRSPQATPADRRSWRGIAHVFGLPEVSFLSAPDLGDAVQSDLRVPELELPSRPAPPEQFVECTPGEVVSPQSGFLPFPVPRADEDGFREWNTVLGLASVLVSRFCREIQFVAAVPIPMPGLRAASDMAAGLLDLPIPSTAFLQLAYPWVRTPGSNRLPQGVESPDAVLAGVLSRNALSRGAFRSAANSHLADLYDLFPALDRQQTTWQQTTATVLPERVSIFGRTPGGLRLLSDVTASADISYRPAALNRLVSILVRAARELGERHTFENSGESLWGLMAQRVRKLMENLLAEGALRGATPAEAFDVTCDRTTMTQNDIDSGRVIVRIRFQPAFPIDRITVMLALNEGGQASLADPDREAA